MFQQHTASLRILDYFITCTDPRTRPVQYPLIEIIIVTVLAILCGEEGWEGMVEWGEDKLPLLKKLLPFENGIPCPDTLRRVIERINPHEFLKAFTSWTQELKERCPGQICIDGKTLCHAMNDDGVLHIVTAWSEANRTVLGSVSTSSKGKEIPAINELLDLFILQEGDVVTIDAIGCQTSIVSKIIDQKADYMIAVKKNQPKLYYELENFFNQAIQAAEYAPCTVFKDNQKKHGRQDTHEVWASRELDWLPQILSWKGLQSIVMVQRQWKIDGIEKQEKRYYISSLSTGPQIFSKVARRHWSIENELHWHLDVTFREDDSQINGTANENLRVARMIALELLRNELSCKRGLKAKMRRCLRSDEYLKKVLMIENV